MRRYSRCQIDLATAVLSAVLLTSAAASAADRTDAVATMAGSLDRLIADHPRVAAEAIRQRQRFMAFESLAQGGNAKNRVKQVETGKRRFEESIARFIRSAPGQIEGDLKRVEKEIERMLSDRPNPRMFKSIGIATLERTAGKVEVLRAAGGLSPELDARYNAAIKAALEISKANRAAFRDLNKVPRDRYRSDDVAAVREAATKAHVDTRPDERILGHLLPEQNWRALYGAWWDEKTNAWQVFDVELLPVIVIVASEDDEALLSRVVLSRSREGGAITSWAFAAEPPLGRPAVRRDLIKN